MISNQAMIKALSSLIGIRKTASADSNESIKKFVDENLSMTDEELRRVRQDSGFRLKSKINSTKPLVDAQIAAYNKLPEFIRKRFPQTEDTIRDMAVPQSIGADDFIDVKRAMDGKDKREVLTGYLASGGVGGLLGAAIAGKNRRLLGALVGAGLGLGGNYLRRKSYYGKLVDY